MTVALRSSSLPSSHHPRLFGQQTPVPSHSSLTTHHIITHHSSSFVQTTDTSPFISHHSSYHHIITHHSSQHHSSYHHSSHHPRLFGQQTPVPSKRWRSPVMGKASTRPPKTIYAPSIGTPGTLQSQ